MNKTLENRWSMDHLSIPWNDWRDKHHSWSNSSSLSLMNICREKREREFACWWLISIKYILKCGLICTWTYRQWNVFKLKMSLTEGWIGHSGIIIQIENVFTWNDGKIGHESEKNFYQIQMNLIISMIDHPMGLIRFICTFIRDFRSFDIFNEIVFCMIESSFFLPSHHCGMIVCRHPEHTMGNRIMWKIDIVRMKPKTNCQIRIPLRWNLSPRAKISLIMSLKSLTMKGKSFPNSFARPPYLLDILDLDDLLRLNIDHIYYDKKEFSENPKKIFHH